MESETTNKATSKTEIEEKNGNEQRNEWMKTNIDAVIFTSSNMNNTWTASSGVRWPWKWVFFFFKYEAVGLALARTHAFRLYTPAIVLPPIILLLLLFGDDEKKNHFFFQFWGRGPHIWNKYRLCEQIRRFNSVNHWKIIGLFLCLFLWSFVEQIPMDCLLTFSIEFRVCGQME